MLARLGFLANAANALASAERVGTSGVSGKGVQNRDHIVQVDVAIALAGITPVCWGPPSFIALLYFWFVSLVAAHFVNLCSALGTNPRYVTTKVVPALLTDSQVERSPKAKADASNRPA